MPPDCLVRHSERLALKRGPRLHRARATPRRDRCPSIWRRVISSESHVLPRWPPVCHHPASALPTAQPRKGARPIRLFRRPRTREDHDSRIDASVVACHGPPLPAHGCWPPLIPLHVLGPTSDMATESDRRDRATVSPRRRCRRMGNVLLILGRHNDDYALLRVGL